MAPEPEIDVALDDLAQPAEIEAVEQAFEHAGLHVSAEAAIGRRSADVLPWVVHVTIAAPIAAFFATLASEVAKDAYSALKGLALEIFDARKESGSGSGSMVLADSEHTNLVVSSTIPEEAFDALREVRWSSCGMALAGSGATPRSAKPNEPPGG